MITSRKRINRYMKLRIKSQMKKLDIEFLKRCEKYRVFPKFIERNFISKNKSYGANKGLWKGKLFWLKFEIRRHYAQIHRDRNEIYDHHLYLTKNLSTHEWDQLNRNLSETIYNKCRKKNWRLRNKFSELRGERGREQRLESTTSQCFVINKSTKNFDKEELELLNNGLKYRIAPEKIPIEEIIVRLETALQRAPFETKARMRSECEKEINLSKRKLKFTKNDEKIVDRLKKKEVVYSHPDKGKGVVIMDKSDYMETVERHIEEGPYKIHKTRREFPVDEMQEEVKNKLLLMEREGLIESRERLALIISNPRIPRMTGLPKIHKEGNHIRPVVTNIDAPASKISKRLVREFKLFRPPTSLSVKNSREIVNALEHETIYDDEEMVSFDVKALFPSIDEKKAVMLLKEWVSSQDISDQKAEMLCAMIDIVVSQKYFQFDKKIYQQVEGVSIGCSLSPWLAEIFMSDLEMNMMKKPWAPRMMRRYVDDTFAIVKKGTAETINRRMSEMHENIEFTFEKEENDSIAFLDLRIKRNKGKFEYGIYRKPTDTQLCIPKGSHHPWRHKMAAFECMIHRLFSLPLSKDEYKKELDYIFDTAKTNGYEKSVIEGLHKKHEQRKSISNITTLQKLKRNETKSMNMPIMVLNYCPPLTDRIMKLARKEKIQSCYGGRGSLGDTLINLKDKRPMEHKSGIYEIECDSCEKSYIGQTKRRVKTRWKEHESAMRNYQSTKSAVAEHCLKWRHKVGKKKLLKEVTNPFELNAWESYYMGKAQNELLNIDDPPIMSKLFVN